MAQMAPSIGAWDKPLPEMSADYFKIWAKTCYCQCVHLITAGNTLQFTLFSLFTFLFEFEKLSVEIQRM